MERVFALMWSPILNCKHRSPIFHLVFIVHLSCLLPMTSSSFNGGLAYASTMFGQQIVARDDVVWKTFPYRALNHKTVHSTNSLMMYPGVKTRSAAYLKNSRLHPSRLLSRHRGSLEGGEDDKDMLTVDEYLAVVTRIGNSLHEQGLKLAWAGVGRDSLYHVLAAQLHESGTQPTLNKYFSSDDLLNNKECEIMYPTAAKQLRLDILRYISANADKFRDDNGNLQPDVELRAAAERFAVRVELYEISKLNTAFATLVFEPDIQVPKATIVVLRRGYQYISSTALKPDMKKGLFANCEDASVLKSLQHAAPQLALLESVTPKNLFPLSKDSHNVSSSDPVDQINTMIQLEADLVLEHIAFLDEQDFFVAFAKQLQVANIQMHSPSVVGKTGFPMTITQSSRVVRSELITISAVNGRFSSMRSPAREMAAAAYKYRVEVICFSLRGATIERTVYSPPDGVSPRSALYFGNQGLHFWAFVPRQEAEHYRHAWSNSTRRMQRASWEIDQQPDISSLSDDPFAPEEDNATIPNGKKPVFFDPVSLSWKLGDQSAQNTVSASSQTTSQTSSSFLPRFSQHRSSVSQPKSDQIVRGSNIAGARTASQPKTFGEGHESDGINRLKAKLADQNLKIVDNESGCNVFLALAQLLGIAGVEIPGLMFTQFEHSSKGSLTGAMSRKARADTKAYIQENMDVFDKPGQWLGDHDLLAAARRYRVKIFFYMVIYNRDVKEHVYDPEPGVAPQAQIHICLQRGLFWPIISCNESQQVSLMDKSNDERETFLQPAERKRASALDIVLNRYGSTETRGQNTSSHVPSRLDTEREWLAGKRFGETHVVQQQKPTGVVIFLHGLGGTGSDFENLASSFRMPWIKFMFPTARRRAVSIFNDIIPSWFDVTHGSIMAQSNALNTNADTCFKIYSKVSDDSSELDLSIAHLREIIQSEIAGGIPPERIVLMGFSQGGSIALTTALELDYPVAGVVAFSPFPSSRLVQYYHGGGVNQSGWLKKLKKSASQRAGTTVLIFHGSNDKVTPFGFSKPLYDSLADRGLQVEISEIVGMGHELNIPELCAAREFVLQKLPAIHAGDESQSLSQKPFRTDSEKLFDASENWAEGFRSFIDNWLDPAAKIWSSLQTRRTTLRK